MIKNAIVYQADWDGNEARCPICKHPCGDSNMYGEKQLVKRQGKLGVHVVIKGVICVICGTVYDPTPF